MPHYLNDGSSDSPKLRLYLNTGNLTDLPATSIWPGLKGPEAAERLKADGFEGIQLDGEETALDAKSGLPYCGLDRINAPEEADAVFAKHVANGESCISLHLGWGMEDDAEIDRLVEAFLTASEKHQLPAFLETHRATITQDMWRTVQMTKRFPEILFNGDFSHLYCGQEMVYGDFGDKMNFLQPVFDRVGFMHGRIAAPGYMQAPIENENDVPLMASHGGRNYLEDFKTMWTRAMTGFKKNAPTGSVLIFAPELLRQDIYYARVFPGAEGNLVEESDRYAQALLYARISKACWQAA